MLKRGNFCKHLLYFTLLLLFYFNSSCLLFARVTTQLSVIKLVWRQTIIKKFIRIKLITHKCSEIYYNNCIQITCWERRLIHETWTGMRMLWKEIFLLEKGSICYQYHYSKYYACYNEINLISYKRIKHSSEVRVEARW